MEISEPTIYDKPVIGKVILRVDTLDCLRNILGDDCFICRELLYTILAGDHVIYNVNDVFASYYRKFKPVREYVNNLYFYGDNTIPILERSILPLREKVNNYRKEVIETVCGCGGKFLVQTHDYVYFAFIPTAKLPDIKGAKIIC